MAKPAVWNEDPECGHEVACPYQTHYCTYIRVPRLLTLQRPESPDELLLISSLQWYQLWLKLLATDLRAALEADASTYEPVKLLRRGSEVFRLFDLHADFAETVIVREAGLTKKVRRPAVPDPRDTLQELARLVPELPRLEGVGFPELAEAAREYAQRFQAFRARYTGYLKRTLLPGGRAAPAAAEWLRLSDLLALQNGPKAAWHEPDRPPAAITEPERVSPDETLFIVVHQAFEIWFRVLLDHLDRAAAALARDDVSQAARLARRVVRLQGWLVQQIRMPATMLPLDFLRFREQRNEEGGKVLVTGLSPASGTESYQFREIEVVCGLRDDAAYRIYLQGSPALPTRLLTPRLAERLAQPTLLEAFRGAVERRGIRSLGEIFTPADAPNPHADLADLAGLFLDFDEFFRFWRVGHVSMVEKMIGSRSGTGFLGPEYLRETAGITIQQQNRIFEERQVRPRFFEELWAARTRMGM